MKACMVSLAETETKLKDWGFDVTTEVQEITPYWETECIEVFIPKESTWTPGEICQIVGVDDDEWLEAGEYIHATGEVVMMFDRTVIKDGKVPEEWLPAFPAGFKKISLNILESNA